MFLLLIAFSSGCGSTKSELKEFTKCGMAAAQLEEYEAKDIIVKKLKEYTEKKGFNGSARYASFLAQEVRDDLDLHSKNLTGQIYTLVKVYNSSKCIKMHGKEKIKMPLTYYLSYFFI